MVDRRVLCFGDSIVAGVGDPSGTGWVGRVAAASCAAGLPITAYNLGVRGETSLHVAKRWRAEAQPRLLPEADCRIALSFGANDTTIDNGRERVDGDRTSQALEGIVDEAVALGLAVFVVGPAPVDDPGQNGRLIDLSASLADVCATHAVPFVNAIEPLLASDMWMRQVTTGDGAHPGADGYSALANLILAGGWLEWLRS
jgi:lysophospholipase L1-like esterase